MNALSAQVSGSELRAALHAMRTDSSSITRRRFFDLLLRSRLHLAVHHGPDLEARATRNDRGELIWPVYTHKRALEQAILAPTERGSMAAVDLFSAAPQMGIVAVVLDYRSDHEREIRGDELRSLAQGINPEA